MLIFLTLTQLGYVWMLQYGAIFVNLLIFGDKLHLMTH